MVVELVTGFAVAVPAGQNQDVRLTDYRRGYMVQRQYVLIQRCRQEAHGRSAQRADVTAWKLWEEMVNGMRACLVQEPPSFLAVKVHAAPSLLLAQFRV
jgi:hypothetical protein